MTSRTADKNTDFKSRSGTGSWKTKQYIDLQQDMTFYGLHIEIAGVVGALYIGTASFALFCKNP